jgi:hypothetical protein
VDSETGMEESADWIPWTYPDSIRFYIVTRKNSKAMNHFKLRKYPIIYIDGVKEGQITSMINEYKQ